MLSGQESISLHYTGSLMLYSLCDVDEIQKVATIFEFQQSFLQVNTYWCIKYEPVLKFKKKEEKKKALPLKPSDILRVRGIFCSHIYCLFHNIIFFHNTSWFLRGPPILYCLNKPLKRVSCSSSAARLQCTPSFIHVPERGRFEALLMDVHIKIRGGYKK